MNKYFFSLKISVLIATFLLPLNHRSVFAATLILHQKQLVASFSTSTNSNKQNQIYNDDFSVEFTKLERLAHDIWLSDLEKNVNVNVYNQDLINRSVTLPINFKSANHNSTESKLLTSLGKALKETKSNSEGDRKSLSTSQILSMLTQVKGSDTEQSIYDLLNSYSSKSEQESKDKNVRSFHSFKDVVSDLFKKDSTIRSILNDPSNSLSKIDLDSISSNNSDLKSVIAKYKSASQGNQNNQLDTVSVKATIPKYSHSPLNLANTGRQQQLIPSIGTEIQTYQPGTYLGNSLNNLNSLPNIQGQENLVKQLQISKKPPELVQLQIDKQRQTKQPKNQQQKKLKTTTGITAKTTKKSAKNKR